MSRRRTLGTAVELVGRGLHSGRPCSARIEPAEAGVGLVINGAHAVIDRVTDGSFATELDCRRGRVSTVEHLLAALSLGGITDARIEVDGGEVPILDGSARPWCDAVRSRRLEAVVEPWRVERPIHVEGFGGEIVVAPASAFDLRVDVDFRGLGVQRWSGDAAACRRALPDARTFGYLSQAEALRAMGRALGANLDNCVVLRDDGTPMNPGGFRGPNELARHKALDLIGDLTLLGAPLCARVTAVRAGHRLHHAAVRAVRAHVRRTRAKA